MHQVRGWFVVIYSHILLSEGAKASLRCGVWNCRPRIKKSAALNIQPDHKLGKITPILGI